MTPRNRCRLAASLVLSCGGLAAQTPAPNPLLPPMPKAAAPPATPAAPSLLPPVGPTEGKAAAPPANPLPELPPTSPTGELLNPGCSSCRDGLPGCSGGSCDIPDAKSRGPRNSVWLSYTQLLMWYQPTRAQFPLAVGNAAGGPSRTLLAGDGELGRFSAFQVAGGVWLNGAHTFGVAGDFFLSEHRSRFESAAGGPGGLTIQRPFIDALTGAPAALAVSNAAAGRFNDPLFTGSVATAITARLAGAGVALQRNVFCTPTTRATLSFGVRYYDLDESLSIYQATTAADGATIGRQLLQVGSVANVFDRVYTRNQFYGGELGGRVEHDFGIVTVGFAPRIAIGDMRQSVTASGLTTGTLASGAPITRVGGLLAAGGPGDGNLERDVTNRISTATQLNAYVGVKLTEHLRTTIGYQFLYLNNVARPGQQFDQIVNQRVVPLSSGFGSLSGQPGNRLTLDREGFYAHGATIAVELTY